MFTIILNSIYSITPQIDLFSINNGLYQCFVIYYKYISFQSLLHFSHFCSVYFPWIRLHFITTYNLLWHVLLECNTISNDIFQRLQYLEERKEVYMKNDTSFNVFILVTMTPILQFTTLNNFSTFIESAFERIYITY